MSDVIFIKLETIRRCISRIYEEYDNNPKNLDSYTKQDSIILNIQRICEACIDIAMHIVSQKNLGIPQNSRDAFELLFQNQVIDEVMNKKLKAMVGFRNVAVHDYQLINIEIVKSIIEKNIDDVKKFADLVVEMDR